MTNDVQEKRDAHLQGCRVSSEAMIEKWGADLQRFQKAVDEGCRLSSEDMRRYQFLKAFLLVSIDRREAVASKPARARRRALVLQYSR